MDTTDIQKVIDLMEHLEWSKDMRVSQNEMEAFTTTWKLLRRMVKIEQGTACPTCRQDIKDGKV